METMASSQMVQVTPGQRCILNLLERKLLKTAETYANLYKEGGKSVSYSELERLRAKLKRISARQKRFTSEIVNGNGNNTIPKESFLQALGLVTKEVYNKLNSKTNERRRRTTANPRFSHEAIQAKRALEPISKERRENAKRQQQNATNNGSHTGRRSNNSNNNNNNNNNDAKKAANTADAGTDAFSMLNLLLAERLNAKYTQIQVKSERNQKLLKANEKILNAINKFKANATAQSAAAIGITTTTNSAVGTIISATEPSDIWIDMKCDESLDGLD